MLARYQLRRGTAAEWEGVNPTPLIGEPCYDSTNKIFKIGDGETPWSNLPMQHTRYVFAETFDVTPLLGDRWRLPSTLDEFLFDGTYWIQTNFFITVTPTPVVALAHLDDVTLNQKSHIYTLTDGDNLSVSDIDAGEWAIVVVSGTTGATVTADAVVKWTVGSSIDDLNVDDGVKVELNLRSYDGTTVWASTVAVTP